MIDFEPEFDVLLRAVDQWKVAVVFGAVLGQEVGIDEGAEEGVVVCRAVADHELHLVSAFDQGPKILQIFLKHYL